MKVDPYLCPKGGKGCGQMHSGCIGHNRAGGPCGAQPMLGTGDRPRCRSHLGVAPAVVQAQHLAERQARLLFDEATAAARREGLDLVDPLQALHELADEAWRWREVCRRMVGELREFRYRSGKAGEQVRAEIVLYERALDRAGRLLAEIVRLGIEERLAHVTERQVDEIVRVLDSVLRKYGLDPDDHEVAGAVEDELHKLAAEEARQR